MKINITGFSSAQSKGSNTKGVINFSELIKDILVDQGHEADYNLENADLNIVFVLDLSSPNVVNYERALKLLQQNNSIIAFDDWSIRNFYKTNENYITGKKVFKTHFHVKQEILNQYRDVIQNIQDGKYKVLFPAYKTGDHSLLELRGELYNIDPSIYIKKQYIESENELIPVHASLATKWKDLEKKKYSILNVRNEKEDKVFEYYCKHRIVLSPPHYHDGGGWFRNRYTLANLAKAVVIEDENSIFGDAYKIAHSEVKATTIDMIFEIQKRAYNNVIMTKQEIKEKIDVLLNSYSVQ